MITIFSLSFCIVPQDRKTLVQQCSRQFSLYSVSRVRKLANRLRIYGEDTLWINALAISIVAYAHLANRLKTYGYMPSLSPFQTRRILRTDSRRMATCPHSLHFRRGASCEQTQDVWLHAITLSISAYAQFRQSGHGALSSTAEGGGSRDPSRYVQHLTAHNNGLMRENARLLLCVEVLSEKPGSSADEVVCHCFGLCDDDFVRNFPSAGIL